MTHDELLRKLWILPAHVTELQHGTKAVKTLRGVVELHKPNKTDVYEYCTHCLESEMGDVIAARYPCKTIKTITELIK